MAVVRVYHRPNPAGLAAVIVSDKIANNMFVRGLLVESAAKRRLAEPPRRIDTGRLRSSIRTTRVTVFIGYPRRGARVGTGVKYARYVHDGTGIYGPLHRPITPTTKTYLKFTPKGTTKIVFAKSVRGMKRNQFLKDALYAAKL